MRKAILLALPAAVLLTAAFFIGLSRSQSVQDRVGKALCRPGFHLEMAYDDDGSGTVTTIGPLTVEERGNVPY